MFYSQPAVYITNNYYYGQTVVTTHHYVPPPPQQYYGHGIQAPPTPQAPTQARITSVPNTPQQRYRAKCDTPIVFAFTYDGGYFYDASGQRGYDKIPERLLKKLKSATVATVLQIIFGPEDSYVMKYIHKDTSVRHIAWSGLEGTKLDKCIEETDVSDMDQICLGKDQGDHFGFFNGKRAYRLCERLVDWLDEKDDTMKFNQVALGYGGSVVAVGDLGNDWSAREAPDALIQAIRKADKKGLKICHIALSLTHALHFFVQFSDSSVAFCVPSAWHADLKSAMNKVLPSDAQRRSSYLADKKALVSMDKSKSKAVIKSIMKSAGGGVVSGLTGVAIHALVAAASCTIS